MDLKWDSSDLGASEDIAIMSAEPNLVLGVIAPRDVVRIGGGEMGDGGRPEPPAVRDCDEDFSAPNSDTVKKHPTTIKYVPTEVCDPDLVRVRVIPPGREVATKERIRNQTQKIAAYSEDSYPVQVQRQVERLLPYSVRINILDTETNLVACRVLWSTWYGAGQDDLNVRQ